MVADVAEQSLTFIDPAGTEWPLMSGAVEVEFGVEGRYMPPVESVIEQVPQQPGGRRRQTVFGVREIVLPIEVFESTQTDLRTRLRQLTVAFDPTRGDGILRSTAPDGSVRQITCRYAQGMELVEGLDLLGNVQRAALVFTAVDPFWYDTAPTTLTFTTGVQRAFLSAAFLPLALNSDTILGTQTITNDGDAEAWPVWTVHGPCTSIRIANDTTGQVIDLPVALTDTQSVVIDTRPFRKTVRRDDGTNLYGSLTAASSLWSLPRGASQVSIELPGAGAASYVTPTWFRRWLTT
jgi:hypothetical protein